MKELEVKEFDTVLLKDGREASVVEVFPDGSLIMDIGDSPADWETISGHVRDVEKILDPSA